MNKKNKLIVIWTLIITASFVFPFWSAYNFDFTFGYFIGAWLVQLLFLGVFVGIPGGFIYMIWDMERENEKEKMEYKLKNMKRDM
jgi:hypothetical protein